MILYQNGRKFQICLKRPGLPRQLKNSHSFSKVSYTFYKSLPPPQLHSVAWCTYQHRSILFFSLSWYELLSKIALDISAPENNLRQTIKEYDACHSTVRWGHYWILKSIHTSKELKLFFPGLPKISYLAIILIKLANFCFVYSWNKWVTQLYIIISALNGIQISESSVEKNH